MKTLSKRKSLMGFIYALIMLLPFSSVLVRCLYVTFNKNAYQSYSQYSVDTMVHIDSTNNNNETLYTVKYVSPSTENSSITPFTFISITASDFGITQAQYDTLSRYYFRHNNEIWFANEDNTYIVKKSLTLPIFESFTFIGNKAQHFFDIFNVTYIVTTNGTLDNAFDYSLYTFLNENGSGRLNLTDWFTDIFLNRTTHNLLYLNYINWYMNYSLLVSCVYLLYSVLMWFLTFARYFINKPFKDMED